MNRSAWLTQGGAGGRGERGRVNQETVVNPDRPKRRVDAQAQPNRVSHLTESEFSGAAENIAQIVKRHEPEPLSERVTHLKIEDRQRVAARLNERRQFAWIFGTRLQDDLRACCLEFESAQIRGTT